MKVEVRYFASARDASGLETETLDLAAGSTVAALKASLATRHPALGPLGAGLRVAVGTEFADDDTELGEGDVVALIPPVSGG